MRKALTYPSFIIVSLFVVLVFVTAQTYTQLGLAVLLYVPFAYFALKIFPRRRWSAPKIALRKPTVHAKKTVGKVEQEEARVEISDIDKRAFLKLVGATGISFFLFSLLGRRAETFLFGRTFDSGVATQQSVPASGTTPTQVSPTDGYKISEIDDNAITYYGFINPQGAWLIMREDTDTSSFRYAKGDSNFPGSWSRRKSLSYDYFYKLF